MCHEETWLPKGQPPGEIGIRYSFRDGTPSTNRALRMTALIQPQHDLSPIEIDAIEECLYNYNRRAIGRNDGRGLGFVIRDEAGRTIGVAAGILGQALPNSNRCGSMRQRLRAGVIERFRR